MCHECFAVFFLNTQTLVQVQTMTSSLSVRRSYTRIRTITAARKLPENSPISMHYAELITLAESGNRGRHRSLDLRRLLREYMRIQHVYEEGKWLEPQILGLFGPLLGQRLCTGLHFSKFNVAQLRAWGEALIPLIEGRPSGITSVSELREIEMEARVNALVLDNHTRHTNVRGLIRTLQQRRGKVSPFKFSHRWLIENKGHEKYARVGDREKHVNEHFGEPVAELLNTDVPTDRLMLARALAATLKEDMFVGTHPLPKNLNIRN